MTGCSCAVVKRSRQKLQLACLCILSCPALLGQLLITHQAVLEDELVCWEGKRKRAARDAQAPIALPQELLASWRVGGSLDGPEAR